MTMAATDEPTTTASSPLGESPKATIHSVAPSQSKVDTNSNPLGQKNKDTSTSIAVAPTKAEKLEDVFRKYKTPTTAKHILTKEYDFLILNTDKNNGKLSKFLVSMDILSVSSPVLRSLIKPRARTQASQTDAQEFGETKAPVNAIMRSRNILELEEDEFALCLILSIIHFCPKEKLKYICFKSLTNVTALVEAYQWKQALQPWCSAWTLNHTASLLQPGYENWLYISRVFSSDYQVHELMALLSIECGFDGERLSRYNPKTKSTEVLNTELWTEEQKALAYGSLLHSIQASKLEQYPQSAEWKGSVLELLDEINSLTFNTLDIVVEGHTCAIQGLKKILSICLTDYGLSDFQSRWKKMVGKVAG
ncbi:hypothetical protein TWF506_000055 [Arthrobotrys conoides]|uniref:BTB domain-containing protein n=1 Tax=Arthrobotrys conoides TaxID=74498 RepID=A0AAN8P7N7_9PEZI